MSDQIKSAYVITKSGAVQFVNGQAFEKIGLRRVDDPETGTYVSDEKGAFIKQYKCSEQLIKIAKINGWELVERQELLNRIQQHKSVFNPINALYHGV